MEIFLANEGTSAVGLMAIVFTIGLLGVGALGWYVVRCDIANRIAERELLAAEAHGPVLATLAHSPAPEATAVDPAVAAEASPAPVPPRRHKGH